MQSEQLARSSSQASSGDRGTTVASPRLTPKDVKEEMPSDRWSRWPWVPALQPRGEGDTLGRGSDQVEELKLRRRNRSDRRRRLRTSQLAEVEREAGTIRTGAAYRRTRARGWRGASVQVGAAVLGFCPVGPATAVFQDGDGSRRRRAAPVVRRPACAEMCDQPHQWGRGGAQNCHGAVEHDQEGTPSVHETPAGHSVFPSLEPSCLGSTAPRI